MASPNFLSSVPLNVLSQLFVFVVLCVLEVKAGWEGESTFRFNYNYVQKIIFMQSLICQKQYVANIKHLLLL